MKKIPAGIDDHYFDVAANNNMTIEAEGVVANDGWRPIVNMCIVDLAHWAAEGQLA